MSLLLKALTSAVVVYAATRLIPGKAMSNIDSLIVSFVSVGVFVGNSFIHVFSSTQKM